MVIFIDKTQLVEAEEALKRERQRSETELEQIAAILRSGPEAFQEFARKAHDTIQLLERHARLPADSRALDELFRQLHSLKGEARYMELRSFARDLHEFEERVAEVRDGKRTADSYSTVEVQERIDSLRDGLASIRAITERFREFAGGEAGERFSSQSVRGFFDNVERMTDGLSAELEKKIRLKTATDVDSLSVLPELRNAVIHLVRNAVDHGIEDPFERISTNKPETGTILITIAREDDKSCRIEVRDDGQGIDFDQVEKRGRDLGLISGDRPSQNGLLKVLFHPRFSSREHASELSGRGVGLDAVQDAVHSLSGSIAVATKKGVGTRFTIRVPLERKQG
jgi:chemotaxis protein histidine kinase CheA